MTYRYYPDTDSLYIELQPVAGADAFELLPDVVVDIDSNDQIVGFDVQHASAHLGTKTPNPAAVEKLQNKLVQAMRTGVPA